MAGTRSAAFVAGVAIAASTAATATGDVMPVVTVVVHDQERVFDASLRQAQAVVIRLYRDAGVEVRWVANAGVSGKPLHIVIVGTRSGPRPADAMGVSPSPGDGTRGDTAFVFSDRVTAFAASSRVPVWTLLGCAIAHELGHLLLPVNAHRPGTIMQAQWNRSDLPPHRPGVPGFDRQQARLLRLRTASR